MAIRRPLPGLAPTTVPHRPFRRGRLLSGGAAPCVDGSPLARAWLTSAELVGAAMCSTCRCGT